MLKLNNENIGYAIFFDYKRRNDPGFRKQLKKESKRQARAAKEEAENATIRQRQAIRDAVEEAKEEGFPTDVEEYVYSNSNLRLDIIAYHKPVRKATAHEGVLRMEPSI